MFYDGVVVPGALLLLASGTWLTVEFFGGWNFVRIPWLAGMVFLFAFEFIEGNTVTRAYFLRLRRLTREALKTGRFTPALNRARGETLPTFTHFLDLPLLFLIVALGVIKPNSWALFTAGVGAAILIAAALTVYIPKLYPWGSAGPVNGPEPAGSTQLSTRFTRTRFAALWHDLGLTAPASDLFEALRGRYAEAHRAYHTAQHIDECLMYLDLIRGQCERPAEIELALWFHDAVYDPGASDNEHRSADWAVRELESAGASQRLSKSIRSLILITRHDAVPTARDEQVIADIDLTILGSSGKRFLEYEAQVRKEYAWVPDAMFGRERAKLLRRFLARPSIYSTEFFRERLESKARRNITASLARLGTVTNG